MADCKNQVTGAGAMKRDPIKRALEQSVFGADVGHVRIQLSKVPNAGLLFRPADVHPRISDATLLSQAAVTLSPLSTTDGTAALADRYGGSGIGRNGGSGRNVVLDEIQIKGIGRTPLVHMSTPLSHASGGAYLEECVREAIFAGVVAHDFPYGAVPVLAIIDTGVTQHWPLGISPAEEARTLLVRPRFSRPAHLERAIGFDQPGSFDGEADHRRVKVIFASMIDSIGEKRLEIELLEFWRRWCHQLAYGFVHRLSHGNNTTSNISLSGALVDFGAASCVPDWTLTATSYLHDAFDARVGAVLNSIDSTLFYARKFVGPQFAAHLDVDLLQKSHVEKFRKYVAFEMLRLCGLSDEAAAHAVAIEFAQIWVGVYQAIATSQKHCRDLFFAEDGSNAGWDMARVWNRRPPASVKKLAEVVHGLTTVAERDRCAADSRALCRTRHQLFKPRLRDAFFKQVEIENVDRLGAQREFVEQFINRHVTANILEKHIRSDVNASQPIFR